MNNLKQPTLNIHKSDLRLLQKQFCEEFSNCTKIDICDSCLLNDLNLGAFTCWLYKK